MNSSSVTVSWDSAYGEFDFHRVTVANTSATNTLTIPREKRVAVVTGLVDGCSYNVSAERVRGMTVGSAASLSVTTGRRYNNTPLLSPALFASSLKFLYLWLFFSLLCPSWVPARVRGVRVLNVSARAFSLRWEQSVGCVDHYPVNLQPNQGKVTVHLAHDGYIQVHTHGHTQWSIFWIFAYFFT